MDTSALVKRYLSEQGSIWVGSLCDNAAHSIIISQATLVEAVATFCRKAREASPSQKITPEERDDLIALFREHASGPYDIVEVDESLYVQAGDLCRLYQLRAYDAVQLACAQIARDGLISASLSAPIFATADNKLLEIAVAEGFSVENPNDHP